MAVSFHSLWTHPQKMIRLRSGKDKSVLIWKPTSRVSDGKKCRANRYVGSSGRNLHQRLTFSFDYATAPCASRLQKHQIYPQIFARSLFGTIAIKVCHYRGRFQSFESIYRTLQFSSVTCFKKARQLMEHLICTKCTQSILLDRQDTIPFELDSSKAQGRRNLVSPVSIKDSGFVHPLDRWYKLPVPAAREDFW